MNLGVEELHAQEESVVDVWPSYVAAIASVVLCVLLLISALSVVIHQYVRVLQGKTFDKALVNTSDRPSFRLDVVESLIGADVLTIESYAQVAIEVKEKTTSRKVEMRRLERKLATLRDRSQVIRMDRKADSENVSQATKPPNEGDKGADRIIFIFGVGAFDLDSASVQLLEKMVVTDPSAQWVIEAGVSGMNATAVHEVLGFANRIRAKLIEIGVSSRAIAVRIDKSAAQKSMLPDVNVAGDLLIQLRMLKNDSQ